MNASPAGGNFACRERARFAKHDLSPLRRACLSLGLEVDAMPGTRLAWLLRKAGLGKTGIEYLQFSSDDQAQQIVALYHRLNATERKAVTLDYLALAAGADSAHVLGCVGAEVYRMAGTLARMDAPTVVRRLVERALMPDGYQDRRLFFQMAGLLPVPGQQSATGCHRERAPNAVSATHARNVPLWKPD